MDHFLPTTLKDAKALGWDTLDIILVTGDAYVDHPSFGSALIGRWLESHGFKVGIIPQPDWKNVESFKVLGKPNLFFCVAAGNLDSMVNNYTADKKPRRNDMYSPNNEPGHRPDRACIVYTNKIREAYKDVFIALGGVEASLRRFAHYDYWDDKVRRSLLLDAKADLLFYGMSEKGILKFAQEVRTGIQPADVDQPANTTKAYKTLPAFASRGVTLPDYDSIIASKEKYAEHFAMYYKEGRKKHPEVIIEKYKDKFLVTTPPDNPNTKELDSLFFLPFTRAPHPMYGAKKIPAYDFVRFSTISHRGCFGGCNFCAISQHQGRQIISRSETSIVKELEEIISKDPEFKGTILDIGGPTANMYGMHCKSNGECFRASCIYPQICTSLDTSHKRSKGLLSQAKQVKGIKKVLVNSGIRYDLALLDTSYMEEIFKHHIGGQLSVAPEHICDSVLHIMGKPSFNLYKSFFHKFIEYNKAHNVKQFLVPYYISAHPGTTLENMLEMAIYFKKHGVKVEQAQNFTPTPMTVSTTMYYTGLDPFTKKAVHVPKAEERALQKALMQAWLPKNYRQVSKALILLNKKDLLNDLTSQD